jgi:hypothetical protein
MEFLPELLLLALGLAGSAVAAVRLRLARKRITAWRAVARELQLKLSGHVSSGLELHGQLGDCRVRVSEFKPDEDSKSLRTEFRIDGKAIPGQFSLSRERIFALGRDFQIGDDAFDREICVQGSELKALALLNAPTRAAVRGALARRDATVRRGEVLYTEKQWILEAGPLKSTLLDLIELARSLVLPWGAVPERLSENAASDDLAAVRLRNLELLQEHFRGTELAREASLRALRDRRLELRLSGAIYLDDLDNVAKIAGVESSEVALRVRAVRHLATADPARAGPLLERLLSASSPSVLRAAAEGIGDLSYRPAVPRLVGLLSRADSETAATVAAALGVMGDPSVEPALLALLDREDEPLRVAAAREAVGSIQSRLGDVEAGRLSVADISPSEGALSLSTGEAGGLSFGGNDEEDRASSETGF